MYDAPTAAVYYWQSQTITKGKDCFMNRLKTHAPGMYIPDYVSFFSLFTHEVSCKNKKRKIKENNDRKNFFFISFLFSLIEFFCRFPVSFHSLLLISFFYSPFLIFSFFSFVLSHLFFTPLLIFWYFSFLSSFSFLMFFLLAHSKRPGCRKFNLCPFKTNDSWW